MADFEVLEIAARKTPEEQTEPYSYRLTVWHQRRRKIFRVDTYDVERAIELAYFYYTGKVVEFQGEKNARSAIIFTETLADPTEYEDLAAVPPWAELPF